MGALMELNDQFVREFEQLARAHENLKVEHEALKAALDELKNRAPVHVEKPNAPPLESPPTQGGPADVAGLRSRIKELETENYWLNQKLEALE